MPKGTTSLDSPALYLTQQALEKYLSGNPMDLLASALFLRMATEARILEYTHHRKDFPRGIKSHQTGAWRKEIEKKFQTRNLIVEWNWGPDQLYYIPISDRHDKLSKELGNWLHFGENHFNQREQYIETARPVIQELLGLSMICCCGNLLGPPLPPDDGSNGMAYTIHIAQEDVDHIESNPEEYQQRLKSFVPTSYKPERFRLIHKLPEPYFNRKVKLYFGLDRLP